jgi:hypothetical protein
MAVGEGILGQGAMMRQSREQRRLERRQRQDKEVAGIGFAVAFLFGIPFLIAVLQEILCHR